jgi:DnaJ-class molecular chaperone
MSNFQDITDARELLGLDKTATLKEIKNKYRKLAKLHHPDIQEISAKDTKKMAEINRAHKILLDYCSRYKYSFNQKDVARTYPHEEYMRKWKENWYDSI